MARYEVFVSDRWPEPLKNSNFRPSLYLKEVKEEDLMRGFFVFFTVDIIWGASYKIKENIGLGLYIIGFFLLPIIIKGILNFFIARSKAAEIAYNAKKSAMNSRQYIAERLSEELNGILNRSQTIVRNLPQYISNAYYCLRVTTQL